MDLNGMNNAHFEKEKNHLEINHRVIKLIRKYIHKQYLFYLFHGGSNMHCGFVYLKTMPLYCYHLIGIIKWSTTTSEMMTGI